MKKLVPLSLLMLLFLPNALAQSQVNWSPGIMQTATWNQPSSPVIPFQFTAGFTVKTKRDRIAGVWHSHLVASAHWLRNESFMADSLAGRYRPLAQLYFDYYELESRRLQVEVNIVDAYNFKIRESEDRARNQIAALRLATNDGRDSAQMAYWRKWMDDELAKQPREYIPTFERGIFQLGIDFGAAAVTYQGAMANYFNTGYGWGTGASFRVKRLAFEFRGITCYPIAKQPFTGNETFYFTDSNRVQLSHGLYAVGYQVVNNDRWSVIPYGGLSTFRVTNRDQLTGSVNPTTLWPGWEAGVVAEWRFGLFHHSNWEQSFLKAVVRAGYASYDYMKKVEGTSIRVQVGIGWTLQNINNVRP